MAVTTTGEASASEAYAATNGQSARADGAVKFLLLGPTTEPWQDAINEMVKGARCLARRANNFRSVQQWASFADEVQNHPTDILWTEIVGGATSCSAMAARQRQQVENLAVIMRIYDSPGKVILVNHSILTYEMGLQNTHYQFPTEWYDKIRGSVHLKSHRVRLCNFGITHPQNGRPPTASASLLTNLQFPEDLRHCRCGQPWEQHVSLPTNKTRARHDMMLTFNSLLISLMKWQVPKLKLDLRFAKSIMEQTRQTMPSDIQEFYEVKLRRIFTDAGADLQFNSDGSPAEDENEHDSTHELYPTESRVKQKEKAHKEQTGERYVPKKRLVVIQPGDDDCGEDDSSILEDTGEVFHYSDVPPPPNPYTFRQIKNFLTYVEGNYNPSSRLFGSGASDLCPFHQQKFDSMTSFLAIHRSINRGHYTNVFELCGGSAEGINHAGDQAIHNKRT